MACRILYGKHLIIIIEMTTLSLRLSVAGSREGGSTHPPQFLLFPSSPLFPFSQERFVVARCELLLLIIDSPFPLSNATLGWERTKWEWRDGGGGGRGEARSGSCDVVEKQIEPPSRRVASPLACFQIPNCSNLGPTSLAR